MLGYALLIITKGVFMQKRIVFRHMDHSKVMEDHANKHLKKVEEFLKNEPTPIHIDLVLEPSKVHAHHLVELRVKTPHYDCVAKREGPDFYQLLDHVIDIMYRELHEEKEKIVSNRKMQGRHSDFKKER